MINILLEGYDISSLWLLNSLKSYIKSFHRVTVIALAFRETRVENLDDWNYLYEKNTGIYYASGQDDAANL